MSVSGSKSKPSSQLKTSKDLEYTLESSPPPFESIKTPEESPIPLYNVTPAPSPSPDIKKTPTPVNLSISSFSDVSGPPSTRTSASTNASAPPAFSSIDTSKSNALSVPSILSSPSSKSTTLSKTPISAPTAEPTPQSRPKVKSSASSASKASSVKISSSPLVPISTKSSSVPSAPSVPSVSSSKSFATATSNPPTHTPISKNTNTSVSDTNTIADDNETIYTLSPTPQSTSASLSDIEPVSAVTTPVVASSIDTNPPLVELPSIPPSQLPSESASESASEIPPPPPLPPIKEFVFGEKKKNDKTRNKSLKSKDDKELESIKEFNKKKQESKKQPALVDAADGADVANASPPASPSPEQDVESGQEAYDFLYPTLDDPNFNIKIASKKEFADTQYDGNIYNSLEKIKEHANKMCNAEFELSPHQLFVRNFLSFQTPYNSLLLYHGLGTGKTCSAITICEEMRDYLSQIGLSTSRKIIVVASPNVQQNFRLQLFDRRKLKMIDGIWNIRSCTGNKYLKEINPMNMKGMGEEKVISEIKKIISRSYLFLGYDQFGSLIEKTSNVDDSITDPSHRTKIMKQKLKITFGNSLIVIDEFHNIRNTDDNTANRSVANQLYKLAKFGPFLSMRLLLLSGTPMYNSYREIVWLINIMRLNDGRAEIDYREVFNDNPEDGIFVETREAREGVEGSEQGEAGQITHLGKENLRRFSTGYVSYIRGENPYTFPFRIYPGEFDIARTFKGDAYHIPTKQINGKNIQENRKLDSMQDKLYLTELSEYQHGVYSYIVHQLEQSKKGEMRDIEKNDSIGIALLQRPLEALNITYPSEDFDPNSTELSYDIRVLVGKFGLQRIMDYNDETKSNYRYKENVPHIFSKELIGNYSSKIKSICDNIYKSEGIVLIYSFYIDGGVIPLALALESMGLTRYGTKAHSLFDRPQVGVHSIDAITSRRRNEMKAGETFFPAKYVVISGDVNISPDNIGDVKAAANEINFDGRFVKVIIISKSGTEGLDFKNIRQTHILEPWYNINLIEQTIGRAVRNCSHKDLEFEKRNVEIFLHGSILSNTPDEEAADVYMYRLSERKAKYIGEVSRVLKEGAIDCLLNIEQTNFTEENFDEKLGAQPVKQILSSYDKDSNTNLEIDYKIGDKNGSSICDYMECVFSCKPEISKKKIGSKTDLFTDTILTMNTDKIIQRIRDIFQERYFYKRTATSESLEDISSDLISTINHNKKYPIEAINIALTQLLEDKNEYIKDKYGRYGRLINVGDYYFFQPLELNNPIIPLYDRQHPIDFKRKKILFKPSKKTNILEDIKKKYQPKSIARLKPGIVSKRISLLSKSVEEEEAEEEAEEEEAEEAGAKVLGRRLSVLSEEIEEKSGEESSDQEGYVREMVESLTKEPLALKRSIRNFKEALTYNHLKRGNLNWYFNCYKVIKNKLFFIPYLILKKILVAHILEELNMEDTLSILNYLISPAYRLLMRERQSDPKKYDNELVFDGLMKEYYDDRTLKGEKMMEGYLLINNTGVLQIYIKNNDIHKWVQGGRNDFSYFTKSISDKNILPKEALSKRIGFITCIKKDKKRGDDYSSLVFKTKNNEKSSIAARCEQALKQDIVDNLSYILDPRQLFEYIEELPSNEKEGYLRYNLKQEYEELLLKIYFELKEKYNKESDEWIRNVALNEVLDKGKNELIVRFLKVMDYSPKEFKDHRESDTLDFTLNEHRIQQLFINRIKSVDEVPGVAMPFSFTNNRDMNEVELCIFQEILLRFFDATQNKNKIWFLTPLQVILNKIA